MLQQPGGATVRDIPAVNPFRRISDFNRIKVIPVVSTACTLTGMLAMPV